MINIIIIVMLIGDGDFQVYCVVFVGMFKVVIIVIQEIFGVNVGICCKCDMFVEVGYLVIVFDLFWWLEFGIEFDLDVKFEFDCVFKLMGQFDQDKGVVDIEVSICVICVELGDSVKVGVVGYCFGGWFVFMIVVCIDVDVSVGYYGVGIDGLLGEKYVIVKLVLLYVFEEDYFVDKVVQVVMYVGLDDYLKVMIYDYVGEDYGFVIEFGIWCLDVVVKFVDGWMVVFFVENLG